MTYNGEIMNDDSVLTLIQEKTIEWFKPFEMFTPIEVGYKVFSDHFQDTEYLVIRRENRVLFYGVDSPSVMTLTDEGALATASPVFARRGTLSQNDFLDILDADNDREIEELESVIPKDGEAVEDFFARNAMWLLNPTIH